MGAAVEIRYALTVVVTARTDRPRRQVDRPRSRGDFPTDYRVRLGTREPSDLTMGEWCLGRAGVPRTFVRADRAAACRTFTPAFRDECTAGGTVHAFPFVESI